MQYYCECGEYFDLSYKKNKQLVADVAAFCSPICIANWLKYKLLPKPVEPRHHPAIADCVLADPLEYWDARTRRFYRSKSEAIAAHFFISLEIEYLYECFSIRLSNNREYNPDYFLPWFNVFVEVKGLWGSGAKAKVKQCVADGHDLLLLPDYLIRKMERFNEAIVLPNHSTPLYV